MSSGISTPESLSPFIDAIPRLDAQAVLHMSHNKLYRLLRQGKLDAVKDGWRTLESNRSSATKRAGRARPTCRRYRSRTTSPISCDDGVSDESETATGMPDGRAGAHIGAAGRPEVREKLSKRPRTKQSPPPQAHRSSPDAWHCLRGAVEPPARGDRKVGSGFAAGETNALARFAPSGGAR